MAYVAVTGGQEAIEESIKLLAGYRTRGDRDLDLQGIKDRFSLLIDKVMSEAGLYAPDYAALALKQSEGSVEEAVFLLRAYRSTLPRNYYSLPIDGRNMHLLRRISSAFKDIPGGQILGPTYDYCHRLLDFSILDEEEARGKKKNCVEENCGGEDGTGLDIDSDSIPLAGEDVGELHADRVSDILRSQNLVPETVDETEPVDVTQYPLVFPAPRSAILQTLARAETGYINGLAYAGLRGFGGAHPTVGELRTGNLEICITHPLYEGQEIYVGEFIATEVESLFSIEDEEAKEGDDPLKKLQSGQGDKADESTNPLVIGMGYGVAFGRNDNKAISMSILDHILDGDGDSILNDQEFVLMHGDCLEMSGFLSHLKLPHYVTFQSKLDRVRSTRKTGGKDNG